MKNVKTFLELVRQRFPSTRKHQFHRLELRGDTVVLILMLGDSFQEFDLTEADLEKQPVQLLLELIPLVKTPPGGPKKPTPLRPKPAA